MPLVIPITVGVEFLNDSQSFTIDADIPRLFGWESCHSELSDGGNLLVVLDTWKALEFHAHAAGTLALVSMLAEHVVVSNSSIIFIAGDHACSIKKSIGFVKDCLVHPSILQEVHVV